MQDNEQNENNELDTQKVIENENDNQNNEQNETVKYETYKKLLNQRKKDKGDMKDMQERLAEYERKEKEANEKRMAEEGEYQRLLELREKEIENLTSERDEAKSQLIEGIKLQAFLNKLPGKLRSRSYLSHVDLERIAIDPSTGVVDDSSVKQVVDEFMKGHAVLVEVKSDGPKLPADAPKDSSGKSLTIDQWKKLPFEERRKRMKDVKFDS